MGWTKWFVELCSNSKSRKPDGAYRRESLSRGRNGIKNLSIAGYLRTGRRLDTCPPDFENLVRSVESRCNWIEAEFPEIGRCRFAVLTADGQISDVEHR
jgi:hypothetical protein